MTAALRTTVVGREREVELLVSALECGAHVLLEGPPGTGKSTLLRSVAEDTHVPFVLWRSSTSRVSVGVTLRRQ